MAEACQPCYTVERTSIYFLSFVHTGPACQVFFVALNKRFTPVRLQAVQSSLFPERKQGINESVDTFAQELKRLYYKAYPNTLQGSSEAETMDKSVLASQFAAGLRHEIKIKLAGTDGTIDQLLTKARFEEAKIKELGVVKDTPSTTNTRQAIAARTPGRAP